MMLSYRHVLKPQMVNFDAQNKIVIDIGEPPLPLDAEDNAGAALSHEDREERAQNSAEKIVRRAERQAGEILDNARNEATNEQNIILQNAKKEADKIVSEARDEGYNEGIKNATLEANSIRNEARQILDEAISTCEEMQKNLEPEIVQMIISITEKFLGNFCEINPKIILNLVKQGLASATISGDVTVHVSADDYDAVSKNKDELLAHTDGSAKLKISKDLSLSPMDCVIETEFGDIDCSLGQQFEALKANLTYILNNK